MRASGMLRRLVGCGALAIVPIAALAGRRDHWLSVRPSQKNHAPCAVPATGIVRRAVVPTPCASGVPS